MFPSISVAEVAHYQCAQWPHQKSRAESREAAEQRDDGIGVRKESVADLCGEQAEDQEIEDFEQLTQ
jgi:hypothetical protein